MRSLRPSAATQEFLRHGGMVFLASLVVNLAAFAFHFDYSRALGARGYGALYSVINVTSFVSVIAGIVTVIVGKVVADAVAAGKEIGGIAAALVRRSVGVGVIAGLLTCILAHPIATFLNVNVVTLLLVAFFAATQMPLGAARGVIQGAQMFAPLAWSLGIEGVMRTALAIALVHAFPAVPTAVGCYALGSAIAMIYVLVTVKRSCGRSAPVVFDYGRLLKTASGIMLSSLAIAVLSTVDVVLVRHYLTNYESGLYGAVALVGKTIFFGVSFIPTILLPKASQSMASGRSKHLLLLAGGLTTALSALAVAVFGLFPHAIIHLVAGGGYDQAARYILPYGIAMAALGAANGFVAYRIGAGDFRFVAPLAALAAAEWVAIALVHETLADVITIVLAISAASLATALFNIQRSGGRAVTGVQVVLLKEELEVR